MKKIIFLIVGGLIFFIVLVGLVFGILSLMDKSEKSIDVVNIDKTVTEENNSVLGLLLNEKQVIIDSLTVMVSEIQDSLQSTWQDKDSLSQLSKMNLKRIRKDSLEIVKLNKRIAKYTADKTASEQAALRQKENIKELAKTYEQMKVSEMKPIFVKLDDKTIIALYNSMSSRKRPMVIKSLSTDRAAAITKKLAK